MVLNEISKKLAARYHKAADKDHAKLFGKVLSDPGKLGGDVERKLKNRSKGMKQAHRIKYKNEELQEGEVVRGNFQSVANRPRRRYGWSHITIGNFPDHFKKKAEKKTGSDMEKVGKAFGRTRSGKPKNEDATDLIKAALAVLENRGTFQDDVEVSKKTIAELHGKGKLEKIRDNHEDKEGKIMRHGERGSFSPPKHKQAVADYHSAQKDRAHSLMDKRDAKKKKALHELSTAKLQNYKADADKQRDAIEYKFKKTDKISGSDLTKFRNRSVGSETAHRKINKKNK